MIVLGLKLSRVLKMATTSSSTSSRLRDSAIVFAAIVDALQIPRSWTNSSQSVQFTITLGLVPTIQRFFFLLVTPLVFSLPSSGRHSTRTPKNGDSRSHTKEQWAVNERNKKPRPIYLIGCTSAAFGSS